MKHQELILVLDFGAQYAQLIARRIRELGVYTELHPFGISINKIKEMGGIGVFLPPDGKLTGRFPLPELPHGEYVFWFRLKVAGREWSPVQCVEFNVVLVIETHGGGLG